MDFFDVLLQSGLITGAIVMYLILFRRGSTKKGKYREPGWNYPLKLLCARYAVRRWKWNLPMMWWKETPRTQSEGWDSFTIRTSAPDGTTVLLAIRKLCGRQPTAEVTIYIKLKDGTVYKLPHHPDTAVGAWENYENGWSANGLKIQVLESELRLRVLYNGLLTREEDDITQHVRFNFIWSSASRVVKHPHEWSDELAAEALALEPWRDGKWHSMLGKENDGSWLQWGTLQGRFHSFNKNDVTDRSEYLRTRGTKERSWAPRGYQGTRRSLNITAVARDGTGVQLRGISYDKVLTQCIYGNVRLANYTVASITSTDLVMPEFCETADAISKAYTINVSTKNRGYRMVLRINEDGGRLYSGVPYQQEFVYHTMMVEIDGEPGTGILELGYEPSVTSGPLVHLSQPPILKWLRETEAGDIGCCVSFEARAAACPNYVGGKGASLALLASIQKDEGYRVPPGFCLTIRALEQQLAMNPELKSAIREIKAANEDYDEKNFQEKCNKAQELFAATVITEDVREAILAHIKELRRKALEENMGPELRFAVRSSAVGEDSEVLSAAGQNETILGCVSDADILRGVQNCWGSMFAFKSAYYRRQSGQRCECGAGVVVQALATARVAGVMFTRHPRAGNPSRLLITANYGLGESVVSGSVEPDSIEVTIGKDGVLTISKIELGSKTQRVKAANGGVEIEDVPETERRIPCLTETEVLRLAQIGVAQEELWGAGRDIEWAYSGNEIFLLQARPITSLEQWTEEELLHEFDFPIMSDDELISFANTGEVMPKPTTPLTYDLITEPIGKSMSCIIGSNGDGYDKGIVLTHNRCGMALFNITYRTVGKEIDVRIRMMEMAIHGHKVADDHILQTAQLRHQPGRFDQIKTIYLLIKCLLVSKRNTNIIMKQVKEMDIDKSDTDNPSELLHLLVNTETSMSNFSYCHGYTSSASSASQIIAMSVLLEGTSDFTAEQCNEINTLLSSGDVLSAEVPIALAKLARELETSGRVKEFRAQEPKQAMNWLKRNLPHIHLDVCVFLEQHGHRAIMEFDLVTKPWALEPEGLMVVLQNLQTSEEESKQSKSDAEIIASLKSPKKSSTRKILRWLLPLCRRTVRQRECTKAHLILAVHKLRLAACRLGKLLVRDWYLPDYELIFFFRVYELQNYLLTRDPALLRKAIQRRQYYPNWCKLKFNEINTGWPEPLKLEEGLVIAGDVKINGTSVCGGEIVARACVVKDLSEINQLQKGDILITHSTDIGWSPYFPLLTGIVTELGGIISHGAVIAREYGLPCIVGVANATNIFKTGDLVRLSGTDGLLERVKVADPPSGEVETVQ